MGRKRGGFVVKSLGLPFLWFLIIVLLGFYAFECHERRSLEKILDAELKEHLHTKEILRATVSECGEAWLNEPVKKRHWEMTEK